MTHQLKTLSWNIHKGMNFSGTQFKLKEMKASLSRHPVDLIFIQEAVGEHSANKLEISDWPNNDQIEYLAHELWPHHVYGANRMHSKGHHGNAILSNHKILEWENFDISTNPLESRGVLWAKVQINESEDFIHAFCTHLNLLEGGRQKQAYKIVDFIQNKMSDHHPAILAGDFNDFKKSMTFHMDEHLEFKEIFHHYKNVQAGSFPGPLPRFSLDRIFYKNLRPTHAEVWSERPWKWLSDHLPLYAEFELKKRMS